MVSYSADAMNISVDDDTEERIFVPFGVGIKRDFKRILTLYKSDISDGLNAQSLATTLFLFFACLNILGPDQHHILGGAVQEVVATFFAPTATTATRALLTLLCTTVTFGTSTILKGLKKSVFFTSKIKTNLSSFALAISVAVGSLVACAVRLNDGYVAAALPALSLPTKLATTTRKPWIINLLDAVVWMYHEKLQVCSPLCRWCASMQ